VLLLPDAALAAEARGLCEALAEAPVRVAAAPACSGASQLGAFLPPQGAVAGVPAGFIIQARVPLACLNLLGDPESAACLWPAPFRLARMPGG
jgi:hypothetical protein